MTETDTHVTLDELKHRIGTALGEAMGMRWNIAGDGDCHLFVSDKWGNNDFVLTIERQSKA